MIEAILLTGPAPLWSTGFNIMQTPLADAGCCSFMQCPASIPPVRISIHNPRAGSKA
jgi:hypothetical protein